MTDTPDENPRDASDDMDAEQRESQRLRHESMIVDRMLGASLSDDLSKGGQVRHA